MEVELELELEHELEAVGLAFTLEIDAIRNGDVHLLEHHGGHLPDLHPVLDDVIQGGVRRGDRKPDHILSFQRRRDTVKVTPMIQTF